MLKVGLQSEKLADSLDARNVAELASETRQLKETASDRDIGQIADPDWVEVVQLTSEQLQLFRTTQHAYLSKAIQTQSPEQESSPIAAE